MHVGFPISQCSCLLSDWEIPLLTYGRSTSLPTTVLLTIR